MNPIRSNPLSRVKRLLMISLAVLHALVCNVVADVAAPRATSKQPAERAFIYGHRGMNAEAPENTLASFRACLRAGLGIEVDVHASKDGVLVVMHDEAVERTTDDKGRITGMDLAELKKLDAGSWFSQKFRGECVPTFEEVLQLIRAEDPDGRTRMILDHKQTWGGTEAKAVELLTRYDLVPRCIVLCKDHEALKRYKQANPAIQTATIANSPEDLERVAALPFIDVVWVTRMFPGVPSAEAVTAIEKRGKVALQFFPTHEAGRMKQSVQNGVRHIVTDQPREARESTKGIALPELSRQVMHRFDYLPEHQIGGMKMVMEPRRYVEVSWKGRMLFSQGGEVFTRRRIGRDSDGIAGKPIGVYSMDDRRVEFDMPVQVEATEDRVSYTWICDAAEEGYRQVNRAVMSAERVEITTTLHFTRDVPKEVSWNPVFFPGEYKGFNGGIADAALPGKQLRVLDMAGAESFLTYPQTTPKEAWHTGWRSVSVQMPEGEVRMSLDSSDAGAQTSLHPLARWSMTEMLGDRRGLVSQVRVHPDGTGAVTHRLVIEVGQEAKTAQKPEVSAAAESDLIKVSVETDGRAFAFFRPEEAVTARVRLDQRFHAKARSVTLRTVLRDYANQIVHDHETALEVPAAGMRTQTIAFGHRARGAYSATFEVLEAQRVIGHVVWRFGVMPELKLRDKEQRLGGFMMDSGHEAAQIELMKLTGMSIARMRSTPSDAVWAAFEPQHGRFVVPQRSQRLVHMLAEAGIDPIFSGEHFPPQVKPGVNLAAGLRDEDVAFFSYESAKEKHGWLPKDTSRFEHYVREWAASYGGRVKMFQVFNEPVPEMPVEQAARIIQIVSRNIKTFIPEAKVLIADTVEITDAHVKWLDEVLRLCASDVDLLGYHHYKKGWYKRDRAAHFPIIEESGWAADTHKMTALARKWSKPVWNSEISWVGCPAEIFPQAEFTPQEQETTAITIRSYLLTRAAGVPTIIACYSPTIRDLDLHYGIYPTRAGSLIGWGWMVKPWSIAHATLAGLLDFSRFLERIDLGDASAYALCFEREGRHFAALWHCHGPAKLTHAFGDQANVMSLVGQPLKSTGELLLDESPVYLVCDGMSREEFIGKMKRVILTKGGKL